MVGLGAAAFLLLGRLVYKVDPLQHADLIYVLGGSKADRALEGYYLYRDGYAPRVLISAGGREEAEVALERQGIHVPSDAEVMRDILVTRLRMPATAVDVLPVSLDNTAQEADVIRDALSRRPLKRLIVVTDCASTRRAGFAFRRALGPAVTVISRCTRFDHFDPTRWWTRRASFRQTGSEAPKLIAYWLGLRG